MSKTLYDKIWENHLVHEQDDGTSLIYVDRHLIHEVTSPQAFEGLRLQKRKVRRPELTLAVPDHNVPTTDRSKGIDDEQSRIQVETLRNNCKEFGVKLFDVNDKRQGIVHIIGPEQGFTQPGTVIVCGDSHTATHGAFGALAFGIGTSEVEHVLATQTLPQKKPKNMKIEINGMLRKNVTSKDVILKVISDIGTSAGTGHIIEFCGSIVNNMSMEERMTVCNMSIEAGAKAGMIAPDEKTFKYLYNREYAPKGALWDQAVKSWKQLFSDKKVKYDKEFLFNLTDLRPYVTWGTSPEDGIPITEKVPNPSQIKAPERKIAMEKSLQYMGLKPGEKMTDIGIQKVFIGSCTNGRIEDLREAARVLGNKKVKNGVRAMVVPGSGIVKKQAEEEGIAQKLIEAGFEWRQAGCSMCLAMNPDQLSPGERCASTSNRNFEGRQGRGGRTHLMSPAMATAAAITGRLTDVRQF